MASSGLNTLQSQLVKTAISTWIDFADLEGSDDQSNNEIMTMTLELEVRLSRSPQKNYLLISDLERSGFFVGILAGDKRPETLGESTRVCSAWSRKLSSQFNQLYYRFEEQPAN